MKNTAVSTVALPARLLRGDRRPRVALVGRQRTGKSSLFLVGRYRDLLRKAESGEWRYLQHHVELDTRVWDAFTHLPI